MVKALSLSPTTIGIIGVWLGPTSKPNSIKPLSILFVFFHRCSLLSGSFSMISRAALTEATDAGGGLALKINDRAECLI